ncbi:MAG TPA: hypothetical protein VHB79_24100 [Polyangiaceae bacterium]|nr:hypothetical protein [Polyangiaceae bacterium]
MAITLIEAGNFSKWAYDDVDASIDSGYVSAGWQELRLDNSVYENFADGYYGRAFVKVVGGTATEVVIAHRGTEITQQLDLKNGMSIYLGEAASQIDDAIAFKNAVATRFALQGYSAGVNFSDIATNAGHSLGGYLAIRTADNMGASGKAVTFDNPKSGLTSTSATITSVLNDPNYINTAGSGNHLGTVLRVDSDRLLELDGEITFSNFLGRIANNVIDGTYAPSAYLDLLTSQTILQLAPTAYVGGIFAAQTLSEHSIDDINSRLAAAYTESYEGYNTTENVLLKAYLLGEYESSSVLGGIGEDFWNEFLDGNGLGITEDEFADEWLNYLDDAEFDSLDAAQYVYLGSSGADSIVGNALDNFIFGRGGNDTIQVGLGTDLVGGGTGDDTFAVVYSDTGAITITDFDLGDDQLDFSRLGALSYNLQTDATEAGGDTTLHFLESEIVLQNITKTDLFNPSNNAFIGLIGGTAGASITGTSSAELLDSVDGATANNDTITGLGANDTLNGGAGNDTYVFAKGAGNDTISESYGTEKNILQMTNVSEAELFLNCATYPYTGLVATAHDGSAQGSVTITSQFVNAGSSQFVLRYLQLTDRVLDLAGPLVYSAPGTSGATVIAQQAVALPDTVRGTTGNDGLTGNGGDNLIEAFAGADYLTGNGGADTITGGTGDDTLVGGTGDDKYYFSKGDGNDRLEETQASGSNNKLYLTSISSADIYLTSYYESGVAGLLVTINDGSARGSVKIHQQWYNTPGTNGYMVKTIEAADGSIDLSTTSGLTYRTLPTTGGTAMARPDLGMNNTVLGGTGNDYLYGGPGGDSISGSGGADNLTGNAGADTLIGGTGDDTVVGGTGNDTYNFSKGDGNDRLEETQESSGNNVLHFTSINKADIYLTSYYENGVAGLLATINDGSAQGSVKIHQQWYNTPGTNGFMVKTIEAADGNIDLSTTSGLTYRTLPTTGGTAMARPDLGMNNTVLGGTGNDYLYGGPGADSISGSGGADNLTGNAGADTLIGGTGDDTLVGGTGNDKYYFSKGDGNDRLEETQEGSGNNVLYLTSINRADVYLSSYYENGAAGLLVTVNDGSAQGSVKIHQQWYNTPGTNGFMVKTIETADETIDLTTTSGLTYSTLPTTGGTAMARPDLGMTNTVLGGTGNDYLYGGPGADSISGSGGADSISGNAGADTLIGGTGDDTMVGGDGDDSYIVGTSDGHDYLYDYSGNNVLDINLGAVDHIANSGNDRTYYFDNTNTHWVFIDEFAVNSWSVI